MRYYRIDNLVYHVEERGAGVPLVLLHGFTGSHANWHGQMNALCPYFRIIAVDLPGHGKTSATNEVERYAISRVAEDLTQLLIQLGESSAHWLGYSMGGRLALYLGLHHPEYVRSLILESASPGLADDSERVQRQEQDALLASRIESEGLDAFVQYWETLGLFASQSRLPVSVRDALRVQRLTNSKVGLANSLRGMGTGSQPSLWDRLPFIDRPVLLIAGEMDGKFSHINRQMSERMPRVKYRVVADAGHTVHLEQPEKFSQLILEFLHDVSDIRRQDLANAE